MFKRYFPEDLRRIAKVAMEDTDFHREILTEAISGGNFVEWFDGKVASLAEKSVTEIVDNGDEPPLPDSPFTEKEFHDPPRLEMQRIRHIWGDLKPIDACNPSTWTYINVQMIAQGIVQPWFFAKGKGNDKSGKRRIEMALRDNDRGSLRDVGRQIVRFLTGYLQGRGPRTLYEDAPLSRTWWTCYLAEQISCDLDRDIDDTLTILKENAFWREFSNKIVADLTVIGDKNIRTGIVEFMIKEKQDTPHGNWRNFLRPFFRNIGEMTAWRALGYFPPQGVADILKAEIAPLVTEDSSNGNEDETEEE